MAHVLAIINRKYTDPLFSLEALSSTVGISQRQIARLLKSHTGNTFTEYIRCVRLEKAQQMLVISEAGIRTICTEIGYSQTGWFARHFRTLTGLTPSGARRLR
ncbi:MAG: AraC family transcriptional regulator [Acidobacteriota bacterium]|nr:AraC family transcriptional regulator [Acidobacteriota bacterium]